MFYLIIYILKKLSFKFVDNLKYNLFYIYDQRSSNDCNSRIMVFSKFQDMDYNHGSNKCDG